MYVRMVQSVRLTLIAQIAKSLISENYCTDRNLKKKKYGLYYMSWSATEIFHEVEEIIV